MPRSIWTGAISFGLVNVPVKLYSAVSKKTVRFHQLHDADGVRIQQKRVCPADGEEVPYEHIVKGYEITPDQYVVVTQEELDALDPKKTKSIEIEDFVELSDIDPVYYDHPYYVLPDRGAAKAYKLLLNAMEQSGRVAIARVVIRTKEQLVAIRPAGDLLTMETMNFADEVVAHDRFDELPGDDVETADREIEMAQQLIDSLAGDFDPTKYKDTYRERVLDLVERKAQGEGDRRPAGRGARGGARPDGRARGERGGGSGESRRRQAVLVALALEQVARQRFGEQVRWFARPQPHRR